MYLKSLLFASFTYGCYRGYTLPKWHNISDLTRASVTIATGIKYVVPPFCVFKWGCLGVRLWNELNGYRYSTFPLWNKYIYGEWGFDHPNTL